MRAPGGRRQVSDRHPTRAHAGRPNTTSGLVVWLVRHAESVWNQAGLVQGQADAPGLTPSGAAHARALAEFLAGTGAAAVVSSDLRRAVETARPIAARLGATLVTDRRLRERNLGRLEGGPASLLGPELSGDTATGQVDPDVRPAGGETLRELSARVEDWLEAVRWSPPAPSFVAVTHDGVLARCGPCCPVARPRRWRHRRSPTGWCGGSSWAMPDRGSEVPATRDPAQGPA